MPQLPARSFTSRFNRLPSTRCSSPIQTPCCPTVRICGRPAADAGQRQETYSFALPGLPPLMNASAGPASRAAQPSYLDANGPA